ncbi:hypothetical protein C8R43DRAFT_1047967 [Mycena crocata]|nr:hypothetical protein C8R43DRAFT_1047967 [Mycena crocata]
MSALPVLKTLAKRETLRGADRWFVGQRHAMGFFSIQLAERLQLSQASALTVSRLLPIPRMSQRINTPKSSAPFWEDCPVDLDLHIRERILPTGSTGSDTRKIIEDAMLTPIDSAKRPPWDMTLIQRPGSGTLLLWRVHHSITDGAGLTALLTQYSDPDERAVLPQSARPGPSLLTTISHVPRNILDLVRNAVPPEATLSSIKRAEPATETALAWLERRPTISSLKQLARGLGGGTVNDVIMAVVAGALRKYMLASGDDVKKIPVMVGVAVGGAKPQDGQLPLGNHFGFVTVQMPVGEDDAAGRYAQMRDTMQPIKTGYRPYLAEASYNLFGYLPAERRSKLLEDGKQREVACIVTNVSGPVAPLHIGGIPVVELRMHAALFQTIGVMIAAYSYNGRVDVSISADPALLKPEVLCKYFEEEIRTLEAAVSSQ